VRRFLTLLGVAAILAAATATPVGASAPSPSSQAGPPERILGMIPVHDQTKGARPTRTSNLSYHNGPVMHVNHTYTIFWGPSGAFDPTYVSTIQAYFANVAADSGKTTNVYYSDTQYYDTSGTVSYTSSAADSITDTTAYPPNGCTDKATSICLSDAQLQTEIQHAMSTKGWTGGSDNLFLIFTPKGVGSCAGSSCAYTNYCAYHSWMGSGSSAILYANQPYGAQSYSIYTCDSGQHPNGTDADATLNLVSHEHNEAITDPQGSAWYDSQGYENGDKCAWRFGTALGTTSSGSYNQVIGTGKYYLQQEWSNRSSGCVLTGQ
jgi:hypothetical protein